MSTSKKSFSAEFKSKVAIEAIKGLQTVNELASEFGVHSTQINNWKRQLLESSKTVFTSKGELKKQQAYEKEREQLYSQIGKLKVSLDWLKKKTGHLD
jgi:transposase-like protein